MLRREFQNANFTTRPHPPDRPRVLVTLGGSDPRGIAAQLVEHISDNDTSACSWTIVTGSLGGTDPVQAAAARRRGVTLRKRVDDMAGLLLEHDIALAAAGSTAWELARCGVAMVVVAVADNQRPIASSLGRAELAIDLGWYVHVTPRQMLDATRSLASDPNRIAAMAEAGRRLIDGQGARRVVDAMTRPPVSFRPATADDAEQLWSWANESAVREASFHPDPIPWEDHRTWLSSVITDPSRELWIVSLGGEKAGQVRFDRDRDSAVISISLDAACRGRGVGRYIIDQAVAQYFAHHQAERIMADIREENLASRRAFLAAGFEEIGPTQIANHAAIRLTRARDIAL